MFQKNDYVVYGNNGVCKVLDIGIPEIQGIDKSKLYYTLQPVYSKGSIIYTSVENEKSVMRKITSKKEALTIIDNISEIDTIEVPNEKFKDMTYKEVLKKNDIREWIKLIKTLYLKNQQKITEGRKIGTTDQRFLREAEEFLYGELSISLTIPKDRIENFITNRVNIQKMI